MKIGLAILNAEPQRGEAERYTHDLACHLAQRGHEVSLLATRFGRDVEPARQVFLDGAAGGRVARYEGYCRSLAEHLQQTPYDVVHAMLPVRGCSLYHPQAGIEAHNLANGYLRHESRLQQVFSRWSSQLSRKRRLYARAERSLLAEGTAIVCPSRQIQQTAERYYPLKEGQSSVLRNAVDLRRYSPEITAGLREPLRTQLGLGSSDVVALLMANNYRLKGLKQAIQALGRLGPAAGGAKLLVVGREPVEAYRRLAGRAGVADRVLFAGPTRGGEAEGQPPGIADARQFMAASDLLVLPTASESCSLVVLEALAMGRPVITTRCNGASEVMGDGIHGFVVENQADLEGLREAWGELLDNRLRAQMSQAARNLRPTLSLERHVDELLEVYARLTSHPQA